MTWMIRRYLSELIFIDGIPITKYSWDTIMEMKMDEIWKIVPSTPRISASSLGRVRLEPHKIEMPHGGIRWYNPKPTYGYEEKNSTGRPNIGKRRIIRISTLKKTFKIAQLVCEAFHGEKPFQKAVTIHIDEDPSNNRPENLRWGTQKENLNMPKFKEWQKTIRVGENSPRTKWAKNT